MHPQHSTTAPRWRRMTMHAAIAVALAASIAPATASAQHTPSGGLGGPTFEAADPPPRNQGGLQPTDVRTLPFNAFLFPSTTAAANVVVDRATGDLLGSKSPDMRWAPASTTKMMTGLLAVEAINDGTVSLNDTVTIQPDVNIEGGGAIGLNPGDTISLRDLLNMALIESQNDAAAAVGTYVGSQGGNDPSWMGRAAFVQAMNDRADEIGLTNTRYISIAGRDPEDLGREHADPTHRATAIGPRRWAATGTSSTTRPAPTTRPPGTSRRSRGWRSTSRSSPRSWGATATGPPPGAAPSGSVRDYTLDSTNQLLPGEPLAYTGAYGVKTGTTDMARENLVSAAKNTAPDTEDVIAVVLGSDDDASTPEDRFTDSIALLDWALDR